MYVLVKGIRDLDRRLVKAEGGKGVGFVARASKRERKSRVERQHEAFLPAAPRGRTKMFPCRPSKKMPTHPSKL